MRNKAITMEETKFANMYAMISQAPGKVALNGDAWSSLIYRGYIAVTAHFITESQDMKSAVFEFYRFRTQHSGEVLRIYCGGATVMVSDKHGLQYHDG